VTAQGKSIVVRNLLRGNRYGVQKNIEQATEIISTVVEAPRAVDFAYGLEKAVEFLDDASGALAYLEAVALADESTLEEVPAVPPSVTTEQMNEARSLVANLNHLKTIKVSDDTTADELGSLHTLVKTLQGRVQDLQAESRQDYLRWRIKESLK